MFGCLVFIVLWCCLWQQEKKMKTRTNDKCHTSQPHHEIKVSSGSVGWLAGYLQSNSEIRRQKTLCTHFCLYIYKICVFVLFITNRLSRTFSPPLASIFSSFRITPIHSFTMGRLDRSMLFPTFWSLWCMQLWCRCAGIVVICLTSGHGQFEKCVHSWKLTPLPITER